MAFRGFTKDTIKFLFELGFHNDRDWFRGNKQRYQEFVLKPFQQLVEDLGKKMLKVDPEFEITPAVDKTISRIYRDTRFSKDKSPYRNNVWISFKRNSGEWKETPVYFFEIYPDYYHYGMGFFVYSPAVREKMRKRILKDGDAFLKLAARSMKGTSFELTGEKFKRVKDKDQPQELREWYERKDLHLYCRKKMDSTVLSPEIVGFLYNEFLSVKPLYEYFRDAIG